jgi:phenylacetate-CoA ligase
MIHHLRHWLHRRRYPPRYAQLEQLLRNQAMSREELLHKQQRDLAGIVTFAAGNTAYYAEKFAPFLGSQPIAFRDLPILRKDDVTARLDDLLARDADRGQAKVGHTGGSTGKPLAFWYDDAKHELMRAGMMRGFMMSGWRPGQKILNFWGARQDVAAGGVFGTQVGDFIAAEKTIAALEYSEARLHQWARFIQTWRPVLLYGYASALSELARFILDSKMAMPRSLLGVYSTAEVLGGWQRELMQKAFSCHVFNQYGCREVPNIAWECRHGQMHVFADLVQLESVQIENEDRFLVTSLTNRLMPFIRYDIGDSGRLLDGECACGSPFPLMEMGLCRQNDLIRTRAGKHFHPAYFNRLLYGMTQIRQYQWVQQDLDRLALNVVATAPLSAETLASLRESLIRDVDAEMRLEVNTLDEIPRTASGKHRFVIGLAPGVAGIR